MKASHRSLDGVQDITRRSANPSMKLRARSQRRFSGTGEATTQQLWR
jgi:hypothetical protein